MNIQLSQLIGERCITAEQGQKLLAEIEPRLLAGESVTIDLAGMKTLLSLFLNNAIGPLFKHFDREQLDRLLSFANPSASQRLTLGLILWRARVADDLDGPIRCFRAEGNRRQWQGLLLRFVAGRAFPHH